MDTLKNDMEIIQKILNKEIDVHDLPKDEVERLIKICKVQKDSLDKRISEKEERITRLESKIEEYKKSANS